MDAIISSALEEICAQGRDGLALSSLCSKLALSIEFRRALWTNLLKIPTVQFQAPNRVYDRNDPSIRCFEDAEKLGLVIVAKDKLYDNFLGIYGFSLGGEAKEINRERLALERIASARTNGVTQSQLSKELGIEGNKTFYTVNMLEKRGLIVRQEAVDRTRGAAKQAAAKLIHLHRYAKHLGSQEKFEITKEEETVGEKDSNIEQVKEEVLVKDYVPSMKAICDKLEEANGKVLVISDIKHDLGYSGGASRLKHRWRSICDRLKNAGLVEEICVKVNGKDECCLHLLKEFSLIDFQQKTIRYAEGNELKMGRCKIAANQLVELPIEHQIYDTIDAAGFEGMFITEVGKRFGIDEKTNYKNCGTLSRKFGMPMQKELHNKTPKYRIRTSRNCKLSNVIPSRLKYLFSKNSSSDISHFLSSESDILWKTNNNKKEIELSSCSLRDSGAVDSISNSCKSQDLIHETKTIFSNKAVLLVNNATMTLKPSQSLTVDGIWREQRILEWLQVEKIVLRPELFRFLVNLEKDKGTTICRKTLDKILHKLENQGKCKYIDISNEITYTDVNCKVKVVLHPSIQSLSSEILSRIRDRVIYFNKQTRGRPSHRKNIKSVLVLGSVQRNQTQDSLNSLSPRMEAMRANGFISGKMVRARLLHSFLWDYACSSSARDDVLSYGKQDHDLQNPHATHNLFDVKAAIKQIPLELFLQVVGSTVKIDNMIEKFKKGVCLCDLPIQEYNDLNDTPAFSRLLSVISILQQLKLIRRVTSGSQVDGVIFPHANPVYALELKPYVDEPPLIATHLNSGSLDLCTDRDVVHDIVRHKFILSNRDAIEEYWEVLEYAYAMADPKAALHAFPGCTVHKIFGHKPWGSVRGMTPSQYAKVKLIVKGNFNKKLPYRKCKEIAKKLNLTWQQVLRVSYAKFRRRQKIQDNLNAGGEECQPMYSSSFSRKRKRSAKARALKHRKVDNDTRQICQQHFSISAGSAKDFIEEKTLMLSSPREHEEVLRSRQEACRNGNVGDFQFPLHTGRSASKFSRWLCEREEDFTRGGIDLTEDLQCGEIFHLFALVSSSELFISPNVPVKDVGDAEFIRGLKDISFFSDSSDIRRDKGFPGIKLSVHRAPIAGAVPLESSFKNGEKFGNEHFVDGNYVGGNYATIEVGCNSSHSEIIKKNLNFGSSVHTYEDACESPWELMVDYATNLMPLPCNQEHVGTLSPEVFKAVYTAIKQGGDQGLAIREVSRVANTLGEKMAEGVIDVLQKFGLAEKVRFDGLFRFIAGSTKQPSSLCKNDNDMQKCTTFNHHEDAGSLLDESHTINLHEGSIQGNVLLSGANNERKIHRIFSQAFRIVIQNPGILEDDIIGKMDLPNAKQCKELLRLMIRKKYLIVKKKRQSRPTGVPLLLEALVGSNSTKSESICREHFFANPMSTALL